MENNNLIILEQLPIIKYKLEELSKEIQKKVENANNLVCNEDTVKEIKQVRANLTKEFNELEKQRKEVKNAIMDKYNQFEEIYKENVSNLYKNADNELKLKIDSVENALKREKEFELREFATQWVNSKGIEEIVKFEDFKLNITLSASMKSLKEQIIAFVEKIFNEVKLIEMEEFRDEIMLEYKMSLDLPYSKLKVIERHKQLEEIAKKQMEQEIKEVQEQAIVEKVEEVIEEITPPVEIETTNLNDEEEQFVVSFTVKGSRNQIKKLKLWLESEGIQYGN